LVKGLIIGSVNVAVVGIIEYILPLQHWLEAVSTLAFFFLFTKRQRTCG
jgi:hypothetical protein